ncbi:MAG: hypothetical protein HN975_06145 [Anaerolineae bacterium]|jgi:hypothetical protein|nr:hypothetical protein [Anaerolineae bacterium]
MIKRITPLKKTRRGKSILPKRYCASCEKTQTPLISGELHGASMYKGEVDEHLDSVDVGLALTCRSCGAVIGSGRGDIDIV